MGLQEAIKLASEVDEIYSAKGAKVIHVDLRKDKPSNEELAGLLLGPTGNLRAPTLRKGRKLIVGFNAPTYERLLN